MEGLTGFILAALALCGSPGPATVSLAATGAAFGPRRSLAYMAGIDAGMVVVMSVTAAGKVRALALGLNLFFNRPLRLPIGNRGCGRSAGAAVRPACPRSFAGV